MSDDVIPASDRKELDRLCAIVRSGLQTFIEVGTALQQIKEDRLYLISCDNFEAFCQTEFGFTRRRANQLIESSEIAKQLAAETGGENGQDNQHLPTGALKTGTKFPGERHMAALKAVPPEKRKEVMQKAVETAPKKKDGTSKVTAVHVKRVAEAAAKPADAPDAPPWQQFLADVEGVVSEIRSASRRLGQILGASGEGKSLSNRYAHFLTYTGTVGALNAVVRNLNDNVPAEVADKPPGYAPARTVKARERQETAA